MSRVDMPVPKIVFAGGFRGTGDFPDHSHERAWELIYLREGAVVERVGSDAIQLSPGMFVLHAPGTVHGDSARDPYFLFHILITGDQPQNWPRIGSDAEGEPLRALLGMVVQEWYSNGIHREAFLRHSAHLLDILMKRFAVRSEESQVARKVVAAVCGIFRRDFNRKLDMADIAQNQRISRSTLYLYFHRVLRKTPQQVLEGIRLRHAVYLLHHSALSMEDVARGSGFCSASHLGQKLRSVYGKTGRQIRASGAKDRIRVPVTPGG